MLDAIVEQRLQPGTHLPEEELAAIYGATRRQIAKALQSLATDELVELKAHRGAFVASPSWSEALEIMELRRVVEAHIVATLAGSPARQKVVEEALAKGHLQQPHPGQDEAVRHSGRFHVVLADCIGNRQITRLVRGLVARSSLIVELYGNTTGLACWIEEHATILAAIAAGDSTAAVRAMESHLGSLQASLISDKPDGARVSLSSALDVEPAGRRKGKPT